MRGLRLSVLRNAELGDLHDEAVRAAEEALKAARAERRAFLAAQVPRSKLAKASAEEIDRAK